LETMLSWLVGIILTVSPINQQWSYPEANKETSEERTERYRSISEDLLSVVYDPTEIPLVSREDPFARAKTALVLLAIANYESGFRRDVDFNLGAESRGDHGRSWCLMQVNLGAPSKAGKSPTRIVFTSNGTYEWAYDGTNGYGGEDLVRDRKLCFRAALHMVRVSFNACGKLPAEERLRVYASGTCSESASKASRRRMRLAQHWMSNPRLKPPLMDLALVDM